MIIRLSETGRLIPDVSPGLTPSVALKFLRNDIASANQVGKVRHGVEENNWDFFANDFHSQLPNFRDEDQCGATTIHQFFASVRSKYIFATGTADTALFGENGEKC